MAAQKGKLFLVALDGVTALNCRENSISISGEKVDISSKASQGFVESLSGAGLVSASISGSGVVTEASWEAILINAVLNNSVLPNVTVTYENGDEFDGDFLITSFDSAGAYNGETTYSFTLESAGVVAYTEAV